MCYEIIQFSLKYIFSFLSRIKKTIRMINSTIRYQYSRREHMKPYIRINPITKGLKIIPKNRFAIPMLESARRIIKIAAIVLLPYLSLL